MNTLAMSLLFACVGIMLAWLARRPARRLVGAGPAFCLWALPALLGAAAWLPAWQSGSVHAAAFPNLPVIVVAPTATPAGDAGMDAMHLLLMLWLAGMGVMLVRLAIHCLRIARRSRPLPAPMRAALEPALAGLDPRAIRLHPAGPAVCWLPRCRLLLPADMLARFDRAQRVHVLAHERMHLRRHDPAWSLLAELMLAALWFFPAAWLAMGRFHLDQELACDAAILDRSPRQAGAYARALLAGTATPRAATLTAPWLSRSQLKERLTMIHRHSHTLLHRRAAYALLATLLGTAALAVHAAMPATPRPSPPSPANAPVAYAASVRQSATPAVAGSMVESPAFVRRPPPRYPADARKNHEQGTVMLLVLVGTAGQPLQIKVDHADTNASQSLVAAATQAAAKWRFQPMLRDGKPGRFWARVPVIFDMRTASSPEFSAAPYVNLASRAQHPPVYPPDAIKHHQQGTVVLLVLVDAQGNPTQVKVARGVTPTLDKAAVSAAEHWRFTPAVRDGKPFKAWARVPVMFSLQELDSTHSAQQKASPTH